ncbi:MAG TPA: PIN domain-containing protein [Verrucomicrobiae bacterium]|nr:PIN domain-containing protein [Verrucomicrobiae bacterium]
MTPVLLDTGPLFAYLSQSDRNHAWAVAQMTAITGPMVTCEPVLTEASYLITSRGENPDGLWAFLRAGVIQVPFRLDSEYEPIAQLMRRYANVPMDLADACLVRLSERHPDWPVFTTDGDFKLYRRFGRQKIPLISPF